ncbi:hypothetical protein GCM10011495_09150 [Hymenobacter frigidus]|uniref:Uncharacterized protein n=1 Tax=Hymenobacter frigidus TaxID=1524095 RepID=A0ABQ1ZYJ0_9BACT|nr:hypothetical protein [Hymenobacter frigidus]GGH81835.1 hypothetical protein GCM10011495_09150 [Hymenobacter frigidus]
MMATIHSEIILPGLSSASGIEIIGDTAYVIGDDSPYLYQLDATTLASTGRVPLFDATGFATGRIPKPEKPDLECLVALTWPDGRPGLLLLGSGSLPTRARGWFVPTESPQVPEAVDLTALYDALRAQLPSCVVLNLEAAATTATELLLFQRTVGRADAALLFVLPLAAVLDFLQGNAPVPAAHQLVFELPLIDGCPAGFSGATFVDNCLFVSASVENTADAVLDGEVLGSFVGVLDVPAGTANFARLAWADGRAYLGKVEGLAVRQHLAPGRFELVLVTDDDAGGSTAAVAEISLSQA